MIKGEKSLAWVAEAPTACLAAEVARLVQQATAGGNIVIAPSDRSLATGGNVSGSTIIAGDQNREEKDGR